MVHRGIYRRIAGRLTDEQAASLLRLLEADPTSGLTTFHRIKEVPKSATLTHLDEWLARLIWLQSLGAMHLSGIGFFDALKQRSARARARRFCSRLRSR